MQLTGLQESTLSINLTEINSPTNMFTSDEENRRLVPELRSTLPIPTTVKYWCVCE